MLQAPVLVGPRCVADMAEMLIDLVLINVGPESHDKMVWDNAIRAYLLTSSHVEGLLLGRERKVECL
jgi:hypothetical protein